MATPNPTRGTRSRISSPFAPVPSIESPVSATDKPKTMLQNWVASAANAKVQDGEKMSWQEPALAPQRASFAEAGHVRHSIVQNMMPLGVGPPAKVLKALAKGESERAKSLVNSTISTPEPAGETDTPEVVPEDTAPEPVEEEDPVEEDTVMATEAVIPEASIEPDVEESSQQAAPTPPPQEPETIEEDIKASRTATEQPATVQNNEVRLSIEPQSSAQSVIAAEHSSPAAQALPPSKPPRYPRWISETPEPALGPDGLAIINLAFTDKIVESAVQEALDRQRWPTAYALRVLWDVLRTDPNMVRMFDAVYNGWHNPEQMSTFQSIVRSKKREGRKDRQAE